MSNWNDWSWVTGITSCNVATERVREAYIALLDFWPENRWLILFGVVVGLLAAALLVQWARHRRLEAALSANLAQLNLVQAMGKVDTFDVDFREKAAARVETVALGGAIQNGNGSKMHSWIDNIYAEDRKAVNVALESARRTGEFSSECRVTGPDGAIRWLHAKGRTIYDGGHNPLGLVGVSVDITERKRTEEALRQTQSELAHAARVMTIGELASSIAHEVNQPLAAISNYGNACLRFLSSATPNLSKSKEAIENIIRDSIRASEVIKRIRLLVTRSVPERTPIDMNEIVNDALSLAQSPLLLSQVSVRLELDAGLPVVEGDRVQLFQVVLNLILNGIEAMSAVSDRPRILMIKTKENGEGGIHLAVQDSGAGFDPSAMNRIFEPFFTTKPQGMGLGLSISRTIIQLHGGTLWAGLNDAPGATFQFTLPGRKNA